MLRLMLLAVVPAVALSGVVHAEDASGLNDFAGESSFEVDALTAAFDDDLVVDDLEVAPVAGSEATDVDAEAACFGFGYRTWRFGWRGYRGWNSCYRPFYGGYGFGGYGWGGYGGYCYRPVFRSYCW